MIGVAISTRNRRALFDRVFARWRRLLPAGSVCVVVDDASTVPLTGDVDVQNGVAYKLIRHDQRLGVAMTKNDGISALMDAGCDDLFLVDDDVIPVFDQWWKPYVESPEPHLSYQWPNRGVRNGRPWDDQCHDGMHFQVDFPRGVMLYAHRDVIDTVGGMDPAFGAWGGEHVEWQARIHEAGLTTWRYGDVLASQHLFTEYRTGSTFPANQRRRIFECTGIQWQKTRPRFVPYRQDQIMQDYDLGPRIADIGPYPAIRQVVDMQPAGTAVEFGVGSGTSTAIIAEQMPVVGFDSGQGLPEDWRPEFPRGSFAYGIPDVPKAKIVEGWFADTLPGFDFEALGYIGLVHFDADLYSSTATALKYVGPHLRPGCYVVFDEWHGYVGCESNEQLAWREFADDTGIGWTVIGHGVEQWIIRISGVGSQ